MGQRVRAVVDFLDDTAPLQKFLPYDAVTRLELRQVFVCNGPTGFTDMTGERSVRGEGFSYHLERTGRARAYIDVHQPVPTWQRACPLRQLFAWLIDLEGGVLLHAAGVLCNGKVAVLAGPSGSGKSSLAAAYIKAVGPDTFLGDDWLPVWRDDQGKWGAHPLYSSLKITDEMATRLGFSPALAEFEHKNKRVYQQMMSPCGVREVGAVIVPSVSTEGLAVWRLSAFEALEKIAPSTLLQSSGVSHAALRRVKELCEEVPCYAMRVGPDFIESAPMMIRELCK